MNFLLAFTRNYLSHFSIRSCIKFFPSFKEDLVVLPFSRFLLKHFKSRMKRIKLKHIFHSPSKFNSLSLIHLIASLEAKAEVDKCSPVQVSFSIVGLNIYFLVEKLSSILSFAMHCIIITSSSFSEIHEEQFVILLLFFSPSCDKTYVLFYYWLQCFKQEDKKIVCYSK